jgi:hypothetical protein
MIALRMKVSGSTGGGPNCFDRFSWLTQAGQAGFRQLTFMSPNFWRLKPFVNAANCVRISRLDEENEKGTLFSIRSSRVRTIGSQAMLKIFVEEAAALASITLFVGMIAVWAQLIPQL